MENERFNVLLKEAKEGNYTSAMEIVKSFKGYASWLMTRLNIIDKVSCYDEIVRTILECIVKY